jgi:hypothetical protein
MKIIAWMTAAFLFIILISSVYAACPEPDIKVYSACTDKCPDAVTHTFAYADCINKCLALWSKMQDDSAACNKAEREKAEQKRIAEENRLRGIQEEKIITVSTVEGMLWLTNPEGLVKNIVPTDLLDLKPGDILRSDHDSSAVLTLKEGSRLQLGPDSQFEYVDGEIMDVFDVWIVRYDLITGRVRFFPERDKSRFVVKTPHATVTHRETDFIVEVDPETNTTAVYLYEGILDVNTTRGETFVLNTGEMMTINTKDEAAKSNLSMDDWYGMLNSIETGQNFTPSWKIPTETSTAMPEFLTEMVSGPGGSRTALFILMIIAAAVGITIGTVIRARRKKSKAKSG